MRPEEYSDDPLLQSEYSDDPLLQAAYRYGLKTALLYAEDFPDYIKQAVWALRDRVRDLEREAMRSNSEEECEKFCQAAGNARHAMWYFQKISLEDN